MGTRNIVAVVVDEKVKVAQYGQWDGYLTGQGETIAKFLKGVDLEMFKAQVRKCKFISENEIKDTWTKCGADPESDFVNFQIAEKHSMLYPTLSRDTGANVLNYIAKGGYRDLKNDIEFVADSLMCEFAYVLDLDNEVLEIYQGFNAGDLVPGQRFSNLNKVEYPNIDTKYNVVELVAELPFDQVNIRNLKALEKELYKEE